MKILVLMLGMVTFSLVNSAAVSRNYDAVCDPHTMTLNEYPAILTKIDVVLTAPLKIRATFRPPNSTKEISAEGIVFVGPSMTQEVVVVACRSLGCSKATGRVTTSWKSTQTCRYTCPDGTSALQTCLNMQRDFSCPTDAMSLKECVTRSFFLGLSSLNNLNGISFVLRIW